VDNAFLFLLKVKKNEFYGNSFLVVVHKTEQGINKSTIQ